MYSAAEKKSKFFFAFLHQERMSRPKGGSYAPVYILAHNLSPVVSVLELIGHLLRVNTYVSFGQWVG